MAQISANWWIIRLGDDAHKKSLTNAASLPKKEPENTRDEKEMRIWELHCQDPWFSHIRRGLKKVEGRKNLDQFKRWHVGDRLIFRCGKVQFLTTIIALRRYPSLEQYLVSEGVSQVLPGIACFEEAMKTYLQWSTRAEIARYGFLAIEIELQPI